MIRIIKKVKVKTDWTLKSTKWLEPANAAFYMDRQNGTLYVKSSFGRVRDGWPHIENLIGWHFVNSLVDKPPEEISWKHLFDQGVDSAVIYYFHIDRKDMGYKVSMMDIGVAVRDLIEIQGFEMPYES